MLANILLIFVVFVPLKSFSEIQNENLSKGYWVRLAQARVMALAAEHSPVPYFNYLSQIIREANCLTGVDWYLTCQNFTTTCAPLQATQLLKELKEKGQESTKEEVPQYMKYMWEQCGMNNSSFLDGISDDVDMKIGSFTSPQVNFRCMRNRERNSYFETDFVIEYPEPRNNNTGLPENIPSDQIPRYFVVEEGDGEGNWKLRTIRETVIKKWYFTAYKTRNFDRIQVRITPVSSKHVYPQITSSLIRIYNASQLTPQKPMDLRVESISGLVTSSAIALLRWKSASGLNASCYWGVEYTIVDNHTTRIISESSGLRAYWVRLMDLPFGSNYNLRVTEKFEEGVEANLDFNLYIPTCVTSFDVKYGDCPSPTDEFTETSLSPLSIALVVLGVITAVIVVVVATLYLLRTLKH